MSDQHIPVMLEQVIDALAIQEDGIYIDATFGRGGHSQAILQRLSGKGKLLAIDRDPSAVSMAQQHFGDDERFQIFHRNFSQLGSLVTELGLLHKINGILMDLGVSSPQLDDGQRGFSFMKSGPLDMRMDPSQGQSASDWLNHAKEADIAIVIKEYGEERFAKRMAKAIVTARQQQVITDTLQLANIIKEANPKWEKHKHPATRAFQAIRIFINRELEELQALLPQCLSMLAIGGRLAVLSFHSLEDRIVKRFLKKQSQGELPKGLPVTWDALDVKMKCIGRKITASAKEVADNPRARSAVLRVGELLK